MAKPILVGYDPNTKDHSPVDFGVAAARLKMAPSGASTRPHSEQRSRSAQPVMVNTRSPQ